MSRSTVLITILALLLVLSLGYIAYNSYQNSKINELNTVYQQGYNQGAAVGYQQAFVQIANAASSCQEVPLFFGNSTVNQTIGIVATDCLRAAQQQNAAAQ
jgi:hypothetical protein